MTKEHDMRAYHGINSTSVLLRARRILEDALAGNDVSNDHIAAAAAIVQSTALERLGDKVEKLNIDLNKCCDRLSEEKVRWDC